MSFLWWSVLCWSEWNSFTQVSSWSLRSHTYLFSLQRRTKQALYCLNRSSCDKSSLHSILPGCGCSFCHCTLFFIYFIFLWLHTTTAFISAGILWSGTWIQTAVLILTQWKEPSLLTTTLTERPPCSTISLCWQQKSVSIPQKNPTTSLEKGQLSSYLTHSDYMF